MKNRFPGFNTYLVLALVFATGCKLLPHQDDVRIAFFIEMTPDNTGRNGPMTIGRTDPFVVNVENQPFLDERSVKEASVADAFGSYQITLQLDRRGTWLLEQYTVANRGRRVAIVAHFGEESRALAAPVIQKPISDGWLVFTPDASREEADRIVNGLNELAKTTQKNSP